MNCDKYPPKRYTNEGGERTQLIYSAFAMCDLRSGGYHVGTPSTGTKYITYNRSIDVLGLSKFTISIKKTKKSSTPTVDTNDIFKHQVEIIIPKDTIGSINGFEVVREAKT